MKVGDLVMGKGLYKHYGIVLETRPSYNETTEYRILWTSQEDGSQWDDWHYDTCLSLYRKLKWWEK